MADQYMKTDEWKGKHLSLHIGRGQKTIGDNEVLEGGKWGKFVGMGFLKKITVVEAKKAAEAPPLPPEREPLLSAPQPPEGLTRSPKMPTPGKSTSTKKTSTKASANKAAEPEREPLLSAPQPPEGMTKAPKMPTPGKSTSTKTSTKKTKKK